MPPIAPARTDRVTRLFASDGRMGAARFVLVVLACSVIWYGLARVADHRLFGTVTLFCVFSGFALAIISAATRSRLHDVAAGIVVYAVAGAALAVLLARLTASQQPSPIKGWPTVAAALTLALILLRPGVSRETRHGARPTALGVTRPTGAARRAGLIGGGICVIGMALVGYVAESSMRGYQRNVERRLTAEAAREGSAPVPEVP